MSSSDRSHAPALFVAGSFGLAALLAAGVALGDARFAAVAVACAALAAFGAWLARRRPGPPVALALLALLLLVPELGLRNAGFRYVSGIQFGYPTPEQFTELELDSELFWTLPKDAGGEVNSLGFQGPEPVVPKPAGTLRFLALGDSCVQQGYPRAWPALAAARLAAAGGPRLEVVDLAMSGYSTHQGRVLAERDGARLEPDLVAIEYGWNDHWLARGAVDGDKRVDVSGQRVLRASRLLQALRKLQDALRSDDAPVLDRPRVPLEQYRENLLRMVALFRACGARVVLLTAPTTHDLYVPGYLTVHSFARSPQDVVELHRRYNDVVRAVQRESGAELVDLEREFAARPDRTQLFIEDGIHFSDAGRALVAELFAARVRELGLVR